MIDEDKFNACYDNHIDTLYRIAYVYLNHREDINDILQNVFMKYLKQETFSDSEVEIKWLIRVTINACKDNNRCFWKRNVSALSWDAPSLNEHNSWVWDMVNTVSPKYRIVLHLYYYLGYSVKEIAQLIHIKESAVKQRLKRARNLLKLEMEETHEEIRLSRNDG